MRVTIKKSSSTKAERLFAEILKRNQIPFKHRQMVNGREIDFIIGKYAVEIDGHEQKSGRNSWLIKNGYIPIHYHNKALISNLSEVEKSIKEKYGLYNP